jgi:hypothetical protein
MRKLVCFVSGFALFVIWAADAVAQKLPGQGADACTLVQKAEIEKLFGVTLADGRKDPNIQTPGHQSVCDYARTGGPGQIRILMRHDTTPLVAGSEKAATRGGAGLRYVKDLGDTAYFMDAGDIGTVLNVYRGGHDLIVVSAMAMGSAAKVSPPVEKLARLVVDRWK